MEAVDATKQTYEEGSFDVIYSRDTILHIQNKQSLFSSFLKWLKPGGRLMISDYCCSDGGHSDDFKEYIKQRGYHLLSPDGYGELLDKVGFCDVEALDKTDLFIEILQKELSRLELQK